VDLCLRVHRAGWKLYYLSEVEILHLGACSSDQVPGAFSILMGCESLSLYMRKYYGRLGELGFRVALLAVLPLRMVGLACAGISRAVGIKIGAPNLSASIRKHWTLGKWAVGLERPRVAG
jgi:GT2 family glycosyltransferase